MRWYCQRLTNIQRVSNDTELTDKTQQKHLKRQTNYLYIVDIEHVHHRIISVMHQYSPKAQSQLVLDLPEPAK